MGLFRRWIIQFTFLALGILYVGSAFWAAPSTAFPEANYPLLQLFQKLGVGLMGNTPYAHRLFPLIMGLIGVISTYKLGFLLYNKRIGFVAALILSTSGVLMNAHLEFHSTELVLMGLSTFAVWHLMEVVYYKRTRNLWFAAIALAAIIYTNGLTALVLPMLAMLAYFIGKGQFAELFRKEWLFLVLMVLGLLTPYLIYLNFQLPINSLDACGNPTPPITAWQYFLFDGMGSIFITCPTDVQNISSHLLWFAWFAAPWSLVITVSIFWRFVNLINSMLKREKMQQEWLNPGAFFIPLLLLLFAPNSESRHFLLIFPFAAIMTAEFMLRLLLENHHWKNLLLKTSQMLFTGLAVLTTGYLNMWLFDWQHITWLLFGGLFVLIVFHWRNKEEHLDQAIMASVLAGLWLLSFWMFSGNLLFE